MFLVCVLFMIVCVAGEIKRAQWININRLLLKTPALPPEAKTLLETNIFAKYRVWATNYATRYRTKHAHRCRHIPLPRMQVYAEQGLTAAIQQYHPNSTHSNFSDYAILYIKHALHDGIKIE